MNREKSTKGIKLIAAVVAAAVVAATTVSELTCVRVNGLSEQPAYSLTRILAHSTLAPGSNFKTDDFDGYLAEYKKQEGRGYTEDKGFLVATSTLDALAAQAIRASN